MCEYENPETATLGVLPLVVAQDRDRRWRVPSPPRKIEVHARASATALGDNANAIDLFEKLSRVGFPMFQQPTSEGPFSGRQVSRIWNLFYRVHSTARLTDASRAGTVIP